MQPTWMDGTPAELPKMTIRRVARSPFASCRWQVTVSTSREALTDCTRTKRRAVLRGLEMMWQVPA